VGREELRLGRTEEARLLLIGKRDSAHAINGVTVLGLSIRYHRSTARRLYLDVRDGGGTAASIVRWRVSVLSAVLLNEEVQGLLDRTEPSFDFYNSSRLRVRICQSGELYQKQKG